MFRDLTADHWLSTDESSLIDPKCAGTALEPAPVVVEPAKEEAELVMVRLVRAYLERRPTRS
jgi:hypothetical protein